MGWQADQRGKQNTRHDVSLIEALCRYRAKKIIPFHTPGHSQGRAAPERLVKAFGREIFTLDLTEVPGLDNLHSPTGIIARAQEQAALTYGANRSFFLVNGTTCGLQALLLASVRPNDLVLIPRNAHRSVLGGLILSGANPVYLWPENIPDFNFAGGISTASLVYSLKENPRVKMVLLINPTYYGVAGNVCKLVEIAHQADISLLVDEAHGAHLRFHPLLPVDALSAGADASVQSVHKLGGAFTQASLLHLRGNRVNSKKVASALSLLQSSSPSYLLMASLDEARRQLVREGFQLLEKAIFLAEEVRTRLGRTKGLKVFGFEHLDGKGAYAFDPTKIVISVSDLGLTGYQVARLLRKRYKVQVELADYNNILVLVSIGTASEDCLNLIKGMEEIALRDQVQGGRKKAAFPTVAPVLSKVLTPREAWLSNSRHVLLKEAVGCIAREMVVVTPPGIPVLWPGEEITSEMVDYLTRLIRLKIPVQGLADPTLQTVEVVNE